MRERIAAARRRGRNLLWLPLSLVWLSFVISPMIRTLHEQSSAMGRATVLGGTVAFVGLYLWMGRRNVMRSVGRPQGWFAEWAPVAAMTGLSLALSLGYGRDWLGLFTFTAAAAGIYVPRQGFSAQIIAVEVVLVAVVGLILGAGWSDLGSTVIVTGAVGLTMFLLVDVGVANRELRQARDELARLAVTEERLRFARDLHDLLGHSLSLIALKSELAGRLVGVAPERAETEIRDVEAVARKALAEVREAVAGYRQPTLAEELQGAEEILSAAGIRLAIDDTSLDMPAVIEAALAWTVREGVTNVIRHSRARTCSVEIRRQGDGIGVEVQDDGAGSSDSNGRAGSGLAGLAERIRALGGRVDAGPRAEGGFRLAVWVPYDADEHLHPQPLSRGAGEGSASRDVVASGVGQA
jgi:two-component system sensor histidine kinase DesK